MLHAVLTVGLGPATAVAVTVIWGMPASATNHVGRVKPVVTTRTYGPVGEPAVKGGSVAEYCTVTLTVPAPLAYAAASSWSPLAPALLLNAVSAALVANIVLCVLSMIFAAARAAASVAFCSRALFSVAWPASSARPAISSKARSP